MYISTFLFYRDGGKTARGPRWYRGYHALWTVATLGALHDSIKPNIEYYNTRILAQRTG